MDEAIAGSHNPYPVKPTGLLIGSYFAFGLYGLHISQIYTYFHTYSDPLRTKLLVSWIFLLSTLQIIIILGSGWKYFVDGIGNPGVWGTFIWPLSFQDGLIPLMAYTGQLYFGRRAYILLGKRKWFGWLVFLLPTLTLSCGIALAVTARLWAQSPYVSALEWANTTSSIGVPSQIVAISWMGMSAFVDGAITLILIFRLRPLRASSPHLVSRLVRLTLETVLLTHICGAAMCIIFLASNPKHRTNNDVFWVLIEVVTELYALSMLFTINSRRSLRPPGSSFAPTTAHKSDDKSEDDTAQTQREDTNSSRIFGVTDVERRVEGYQGDTPFGVHILPLVYHGHRRSMTDTNAYGEYSLDSLSPESSAYGPLTPGDELEKSLEPTAAKGER